MSSLLLVIALGGGGARAGESVPAAASPPPDSMEDIKKSVDKLAYRFEPNVFETETFPPGSFVLGDRVQSAFGPLAVRVSFYNEKFEEVTTATTPGRYGAVVRITGKDGKEMDRFVTLYRTPVGVTWQNLENLRLPVVAGDSPEAKRVQEDAVGTALIGGVVDGTRRTFVPGMMRGLAKVAPGLRIEAIFYGYKLRDDAWWCELRKRVGLPVHYAHEIRLPDGYESDAAKRWPLILFLHGAGERGDDIRVVSQSSIPSELDKGRKIPAVVLWPQCPRSESWSAPALLELIDEVSAKYRVDRDRVIVTGQSAGGLGTWALATSYPDRFAAIAPICGFCDPAEAVKLKNLPVWVFHGKKDPLVPVQMSEAIVAAIKKAGGNPHLTIYPNVEHEAWNNAYATDALYAWMLDQRRGQPDATSRPADR